jgi:hypothetical protein
MGMNNICGMRDEKGVLYLTCRKALYGRIEEARLFYDD